MGKRLNADFYVLQNFSEVGLLLDFDIAFNVFDSHELKIMLLVV